MGRASVLQPRRRVEHLCPLKKARKGDVQPSFLGVSLEHARFFRQLRRLQSLVRVLRVPSLTWNAQVNRDETWRAIRMAAGFPGGFGPWWNAHSLLPVVPEPLPLCCPSLDFVAALFDGFQAFMSKYESALKSQRYQSAKQRRVSDLRYVFQDCQADPLPQADTLLDRLNVAVEEVRQEDHSLVLARPVCLLDDVPVVVDGQVVSVVAASDDQVWVESTEGLQVGAELTQERALVSDDAILARFADVWQNRWVKHAHVVPGQWDQICGFLDRTVRPLQWRTHPWTPDRLFQAVKAKKKRAAVGPDGVSRQDLLSLPPSALASLTGLFDSVESGMPWPIQLATGFVNSLAKVPHAQHVDEFRPVVVYSLLYRVWSTVRAREALSTVAALLPDSVQGGVPGRQAKVIWFELASALEQAYMNGEALHGILMDIQKCFNNIPRYPLWYALHRMGFPVHVLRAWVSFVAGQTRRFRVRQSVGSPIPSNCGLPEGCAMSVFGMSVIDWILDWWLKNLEVRVDLRTFVDDCGVLFRDPSAYSRVWASLEQFTRLMDLSLDLRKSRTWSTDAGARRDFRAGPVPVAHSVRNLGAHQNFTRHSHNAILQQRLSQLPPIWSRLRASHSPYHHKIMALHMLAWPRALHGITVVHLGASHYKVLRSGAMKALKADRKGSNPFLHLASAGLVSDPEAWSILQTFRDARELGKADTVEPLLGLLSGSSEALPFNGPTNVLLSRVRRLGWEVGSQGLLQDSWGSFSLMDIAWDELQVRVKLSWGHILASELSHRPTFGGIGRVDLSELSLALSTYGAVDQVYLRCHLDGTLFTQNGQAKFRPGVSDRCPWCTSKDGFAHRAWECAFFAPCRSHLTSCQLDAISALPPCLRDHGWPLRLSEWDLYSEFLLSDANACRMSPIALPTHRGTSLLDLFVDGTCSHPKEPKLRYAAWVVTMVPGGPGSLDSAVLLGGHVRGLCQSPFRAELAAVTEAVLWACERQQPVRIWCDCQGVVRRLQRLLRGGALKRNLAHSDLWQKLQVVLVGNEELIQVRKVVSHGSLRLAQGPVEEWVYWHNGLADAAAEAINSRRCDAFWHVWNGLQTALDRHRTLHRLILSVLLKTSRMAAASQQSQRPNPPVVQVPQQVAVVETDWNIPGHMVKRYGEINVRFLHDWWMAWFPTMLNGTAPLSYISGVQLFHSFFLHTGYRGPWCHRKQWFSSEQAAPAKAQQTWGARTKLFLMMWKGYIRAHQVTIPQKLTRPNSSAISRWLVSYKVRWTPAMVETTDRFIFEVLGRQATSAGDVASLVPQ